MILVSLDGVGRSIADRALFQGLSLGFDDGERVGLIGPNGAGKSSLLRIISGIDPPDEGRVVARSDCRIEMLGQNPAFDDEAIAAQVIGELPAFGPEAKQAERLLQRLQLNDLLTAPVAELSGGQRRKLELARVLLSPADLLLLDEPTNHLDMETIVWLERELAGRSQAILFATHDRYFLDRVATRIASLENGALQLYRGDYEIYLQQRAEREAAQQKAQARAQSFLKKEYEWLRRQPKARGTKQRARIDRVARVESQAVAAAPRSLTIEAQSRRLGGKILEARALSCARGGRPIFAGFDRLFRAGERLGIVGPNGAGKTTLLHTLAGRLPPNSGQLIRGVNTRLAYFDQHNQDLPEAMRVIDYIEKEAGALVENSEGARQRASDLLDSFLFDDRMQYTTIGRLSGGERRRLHLVRILLDAPNFLVLDEPTNDLDLDSLSALEEFLVGFPGVVVFVSHDRYFVDRVATELLALDLDTTAVQVYSGACSEYLEERLVAAESRMQPAPTAARRAKLPKVSPQELRKRLSVLEREIEALEKNRAQLNELLSGAESDRDRIRQAAEQLQQTEAALAEKMEQWEAQASALENGA